MPPVLVMTSTFSGFFQAQMLPSRSSSDLLGGMWSLLQTAGVVPNRLVWDNEGLAPGMYSVKVDLGDGVPHAVLMTLK